MSSSDSSPPIVRPAFFDGERLTAADLASIEAHHRALRWMHHRALHDWGVATGLEVRARRGSRDVEVTPGYALDAEGREVLLQRPVVLPVPPVAGRPSGGARAYLLTASYVPDESQPPDETRPGVCGGEGATRLPETARIRWQDPTDLVSPASRFRRGLDVVLAAMEVENCALAADPSIATRRSARPAAQPFVASGRTPDGATAWTLFRESGVVAGVETLVDTSAAGFALRPVYSATVAGTRARTIGGQRVVIDGTAHVADARADRFTLRVPLPRDLQVGNHEMNPSALLGPGLPALVGTLLNWYVEWIGIEA